MHIYKKTLLIFYSLFVILSCAQENSSDQILKPTATSLPSRTPVPFEKISGATKLYVLSNNNLDKKIYLLGEVHSTKGCSADTKHVMTASEWVYNLPRYTDKMVDIFLEVAPPFDPKRISKAIPVGRALRETEVLPTWAVKSQLAALVDKLTPCYTPPHRCPYANMRVHWTDFRYYWIQKIADPSIVIDFAQIFKFILPDSWTDGGIRIIIGPDMKYFLDINSMYEYIKNKLILSGKIKKQWDTVPREYLDIFLAIMKTDLENIYKDILPQLKKAAIIQEDGRVSLPKTYLEYIMDEAYVALVWYTDAYTMGRFLRMFPNKESIKNAVMVNGDRHTENMKDFLINIGFTLEQSYSNNFSFEDLSKPNFEQCLDIRGLTEPYF